MATELERKAQERSSYGILVEFFELLPDETSTPITPNAGLNWSLLDAQQQIVNGRQNVLLTPDESVVIMLSGDDLALDENYPEVRYVIVEGTYDSIYGSNLDLRAQVSFQIENLYG